MVFLLPSTDGENRGSRKGRRGAGEAQRGGPQAAGFHVIRHSLTRDN